MYPCELTASRPPCSACTKIWGREEALVDHQPRTSRRTGPCRDKFATKVASFVLAFTLYLSSASRCYIVLVAYLCSTVSTNFCIRLSEVFAGLPRGTRYAPTAKHQSASTDSDSLSV